MLELKMLELKILELREFDEAITSLKKRGMTSDTYTGVLTQFAKILLHKCFDKCILNRRLEVLTMCFEKLLELTQLPTPLHNSWEEALEKIVRVCLEF